MVKIIVKKSFTNDKIVKATNKVGLNEARDYCTNNNSVTVKGSKNSIVFITRSNEDAQNIKLTLNNYAIPFQTI